MADISKFINDPKLRKERIQEKRKILLEFISSETFTTTEIAADLLKISRQACLKTLKAMEEDGLIKMHDLEFSLAQKGKQVIWGLTPKGALLAADLDDFRVDYYEVGRVSIMTIPHSLDIQRARVHGLRKGFTEWKSSRKLRQMAEKDRGVWLQIPDAVAKDESGQLVAFEIERTVKTPKRYNEILSNFAQMFLDRTVSEVFYICPDDLANRLKKLFSQIEKMIVNGQIQPVHPKVREKIKFVSYSEWEVS